MNILVLSREFPPYVLGGISYHLKNLYNEISSKGHNITVLGGKCPQAWSALQGQVSSDINNIPVEFGYRKGYYVLYPVALKYKLQSIDTERFDVAISHTPIPYKIPATRMITKYHDCIERTRPYVRNGLSMLELVGESILHPFRTLVNKHSLKKSDHAIFNSNINKKGWMNNYSPTPSNSVIYNGVDTELFLPNDISEDYVLFVGDSKQKGITSVVEYANKNEKTVHVVGAKYIDHKNVVNHGRVSQEQLVDLYSRATATIHPARFESFGNSILESLACGTPVVTTSNCGASEILTEGTGIITKDLSQGIDIVSDYDSDDCRSLAKQYSWEKVAEETIGVVREVIDENGG